MSDTRNYNSMSKEEFNSLIEKEEKLSELDELKNYSKAQHLTITAQCKKINELERKIEAADTKILRLEQTETTSSVLSKEGQESDGERICLVQLAILSGMSMNRELTLEECKKTEIYVKTLQTIRGKVVEKEKNTEVSKRLTTAELMELVDKEMKN
jgi:hypothetical protein